MLLPVRIIACFIEECGLGPWWNLALGADAGDRWVLDLLGPASWHHVDAANMSRSTPGAHII